MIYFRRPLLFPTVSRVPSKISVGPLTAVTPRGPPAAHTANTHAHTFYTPRRRRQDPTPPSSATCAGRRWMCPDAPTPTHSAPPPRRPHTSVAARTPAHLPRRPHSAPPPPPPPLEPPAPGFARRRRLPGNGITIV
jgi:hypothetical protein